MPDNGANHWLNLFVSESLVNNFTNGLKHGREQIADKIDAEGQNLASVIQANADIVRRAMKLAFEKEITYLTHH